MTFVIVNKAIKNIFLCSGNKELHYLSKVLKFIKTNLKKIRTKTHEANYLSNDKYLSLQK